MRIPPDAELVGKTISRDGHVLGKVMSINRCYDPEFWAIFVGPEERPEFIRFDAEALPFSVAEANPDGEQEDMNTEIEEEVHRIVRRQTGREKDETTSLDSSLVDDLKMDSLDILEVVIDIEGERTIAIDNDELADVVTVRDLARLVERSIEKAKASSRKAPA